MLNVLLLTFTVVESLRHKERCPFSTAQLSPAPPLSSNSQSLLVRRPTLLPARDSGNSFKGTRGYSCLCLVQVGRVYQQVKQRLRVNYAA